MKLINLTPHTISIYTMDGDRPLMSIEPSGTLARCTQTDAVVDGIYCRDGNKLVSIPLVESQFGDVEGLPAPNILAIEQRGYIVSRMALEAIREKDESRIGRDVFAPGPAVRDQDGRIIGCRGLSV